MANVGIILRLISNTDTTLYAGCPTTVSFTPSVGTFVAGDLLTCSSDGYPQPNYQWSDVNGAIVFSTSTVTLPEGPFNLTCTATGNLAAPCSASDSISGIANSKYR